MAQRITTPNRAINLWGAGKDGWRAGNKAAFINATENSSAFMNMLQEEIAAFPEYLGKALDPNNNQQVLQAVLALIEARSGNYALDTGAANAYVIALSPVITAYAGNFSGSFKAVNANTGASTLNAGGGAIALVNDVGGALVGGDIQANSIVSYNYSFADGKAYITSIVQSQDDARYGSSQFSIGATVTANALTGMLNPCKLDFRNPILPSGVPINYCVAAALSCIVPSGATLGTVSGNTARLVWIVAYNAGTPVLCVANIAGGLNLDETTPISPTIISSGATSAGVIYSASAVAANSPFRVVGFCDIYEGAAGTWATAPSTVQGMGGQAWVSMGSLGYGQTYLNVAAGRVLGTTYYNSSGKPIYVNVSVGITTTTQTSIQATANGISFYGTTSSNSVGNSSSIGFIVPPGASYSVAGAGGTSSISSWVELR